jgi:hypothetical protein
VRDQAPAGQPPDDKKKSGNGGDDDGLGEPGLDPLRIALLKKIPTSGDWPGCNGFGGSARSE